MHVYLGDFGLSKLFSQSQLIGTATMRCGTPGFQAPEQLQRKNISTKCDIYALGGVLTELYGERPLWPDTLPHQIMFSVVVQGVFPHTDHLPNNVKRITDFCFTEEEKRCDAPYILFHLLSL